MDGKLGYSVEWPSPEKAKAAAAAADDGDNEPSHHKLECSVTLPTGVGPGSVVTIPVPPNQDLTPAGEGQYAGEAASRMPPAVLALQDDAGRTAFHVAVAPLEFGSYENTSLLSSLLDSVSDKALLGVRDDAGLTAVELAQAQGSGAMLRCLQSHVPALRGLKGGNDPLPTFPDAVDVDTDARTVLETAEEKVCVVALKVLALALGSVMGVCAGAGCAGGCPSHREVAAARSLDEHSQRCGGQW